MTKLFLSIIDGLVQIWKIFLKRKKAGDAFVDAAILQSLIKDMVHEKKHLNIERFFIVKAHNGQSGKKLMPVGYKYCSVLFNDQREPFHDQRERYQVVPLDLHYIQLIASINIKKQIDIVFAEMENGMLKNFYAEEGVKYAQHFYIKDNKEEFWFLSIATSIENEKFETPEQKNEIMLAVSKVRRIVNSY